MEGINKKLGNSINNESNVSKIISNLHKNKFIEKHACFIKKNSTNVYEMGYISKKNKEVPYAIEKFQLKVMKKNLSSMGF